MTERQKIKKFDKIKAMLDTLDKESQKKIVWAHLRYLLDGDKKGIGWLLDELGEFLDQQGNILLSPFQ